MQMLNRQLLFPNNQENIVDIIWECDCALVNVIGAVRG